jgi:hypothetical protein
VRGVRALTLTVTGILVGLAVDYLAGHVPLAVALAAAVASYGAGSLAAALSRGILAGLAWLALAYMIVGAVYPGSLEIVSLTASIAGLPAAAAYAVTFLIALITAAAISTIIHFSARPGREEGSQG